MEKRKIKIIHIIPTLDMGGAERAVVDIAKNLNPADFQVKVICLKRFGHWGLELKNKNVEMISLGQKDKLGILILPKLIRILKRENPDIVHTHLFGADFYGRLAAWLAGVDIIVSTEHNLNISEGRIKKILKKYSAALAKAIVASSSAIEKYLIKSEGAKADKISVIRYGIEVDKFLNKQRVFVGKEEIILGFMGRLTEQKGVDLLIGALAKLRNQKIVCRIAGQGELQEELKRRIVENNSSNKVSLLGQVKNSKNFFDELDIFILPSRWEGLGIVILEAALSGLPVIASNIDGIKEVIENGISGILTEPGDIDALAEKIKNLAGNPEERKRLGLNLQNKVKNEFNLERMVGEYENLYFKLINNESNNR